MISENLSSQDLPIGSSSQERLKHFHGNGSSGYSEDDFKVMAIELNTIAGLMAGVRAFCAASNMEASWFEKFRLVEKTLKHFAAFKFETKRVYSMHIASFATKTEWMTESNLSIHFHFKFSPNRCLPFQQSQCLQCLPISRLCRILPRAHCRPSSLLLGDPICQQISSGRRAYKIMNGFGCRMFGLTP